jgi:hypothetical protein
MKKRIIFFPFLLAFLAFSAFLRTTGSDHVRTVQILSLIATGMCLGVALANLRALYGAKPQD